jgi:formylglycine-generating enzyme required for sulfatase activity
MRIKLFILFLGTYLLPWLQKPLVLNKQKTHFYSVSDKAIYASAYETSNSDYMSYLTWLQNNESQEAYKKAFPDTNVWVSGNEYREKLKTYYFLHPAYREYPVVGVTYDQAVAYCQWLTKIWNNSLPDKRIKKVIFRLPTESEWETAAYGGKNHGIVYPWGTDRIDMDYVTHKNPILANYRSSSKDYMGFAGSLTDGLDATTAVKNFSPNTFGL